MQTRPSQRDRPTDSSAGNDEQFRRKLMAVANRLRRFARRLAGDDLDAEDLLQQTLVRCWKARGTFEIGTSLFSWAARIMRNWRISRWRSAPAMMVSLEDISEVSVEGDQSFHVTSGEIAAALATMIPTDRQAIGLAAQGYKYKKIADELGLSVGGAKARVSRARRLLSVKVRPDDLR